MTEPKTYIKNPTPIKALQWDGSPQRAEALIKWTMTTQDKQLQPQFVLLGTERATRVLGPTGHPAHVKVDEPVTRHRQMLDNGATAVLFVAANDDWLGIKEGEWVAQDAKGFYPIDDEIFANYVEADKMDALGLASDPKLRLSVAHLMSVEPEQITSIVARKLAVSTALPMNPDHPEQGTRHETYFVELS